MVLNFMAKSRLLTLFKTRLKRSLLPSRRTRSLGFTLLELLVVMAISSAIIAGLMYIVVELMSTDQRESSRSETQREMQMALDYMSTELREAVFVYTADNLTCAGPTVPGSPPCSPLTTYLPTSISNNSVPILAFWKQEPFPRDVLASSKRAQCFGNAPPPGISCLTNNSYSLVVYSLTKPDPGSKIWSDKNFRITRYALTEFNSKGDLNTGYVNPGAYEGNQFATWPILKDSDGVVKNIQNVAINSGRPPGRPIGNAVTLVDFVDAQARTVGGKGGAGEATACPNLTDYALTPNAQSLANAGFGTLTNPVRSFYACISVSPTLLAGSRIANPSENQEVILHLQGNAYGRPGILRDELLSALETRILSRGVLTRRPAE
jgi:prepilin-type N-terminal cleavage/methylation domain-containing protein